MEEVTAADFPPGRWHARWVWCEVPELEPSKNFLMLPKASDKSRFGCFRRTFELPKVPDRVPARVSADSRYVLWVNGAEVSRGPVRCNQRRLHYDPVDLAPHLRPGANAIAVLVRFYGVANPWWAPAPPGGVQLGGGALVFETRLGKDSWLVTDAEWRTLAADAWTEIGDTGIGAMRPESHDGRRLPPDWREFDFDDSAWQPATLLAANTIGFTGSHEPPSHPYGPLLPRPIPQLGKTPRHSVAVRVACGPRPEDRLHPVDQVLADTEATTSVATPEDAVGEIALDASTGRVHVLTFDFGEVVSGTVVLDLEAPPGARFDLAAAEFATEDGRLSLDQERCGLRYIARGVNDRFESFDSLGLRYAGLSVRADSPVKVRAISVNERLYPRREGPFFACSNPVLDKIWAVGRRTVDINSQDAYLDCPTREQRGWTGDFVVHQMVDLTSNPDWGLARWNVEMTASPRPDGMLPMAAGGDVENFDAVYIPDWALHWVRSLHNLYRYTGDRDLVGRLLPVAEGVLRWFVPFQAQDGLITDVTGWVLIDWSSVTTAGKCSVLNALWARGLLDFAEMADWLADAGRSQWARAAFAAVAAGFEAFWDPVRRLYADHIEAGVRGRPASQHAQAASLAAGLVPGDRVGRLVELLTDKDRHVHATWAREKGDARINEDGAKGTAGPYLFLGPPPPWWDIESKLVLAQPFFRYVVHDALAAAGREDLIAAQCLDWQYLFQRSETAWSETWFGGTVSHGWSSTPTRDLLSRTLGVTPAVPGFGAARIAPRLGVLSWARGAVPTPYGLLSVDVRQDRVEIDSPMAFELDLEGMEARPYPAGRHTISRCPEPES